MKVGLWNEDKIAGDNWAEVKRIERDKFEGSSVSSIVYFELGTSESDIEKYIEAIYNETDVKLRYEILIPIDFSEFIEHLGLTNNEESETLYAHYCDIYNEKPDN